MQAGGGGASQLNEYKSGDQPVTECWTAGFEDLTPFIIFACRIQFTEPKDSGEAERPLTLSERGVWPEAEPTCLFITCFMFVLYCYGDSDRLHQTESTVLYKRRRCAVLLQNSQQSVICARPFCPTGLTLCMFDSYMIED